MNTVSTQSTSKSKVSNLIFIVVFVSMILAMLALITLIASAQHGIDANWSAQTTIAKSSTSVSADGAVANNMVVQKDGTVLLFYTETSGSRRTPYYVGSRDNGRTWNAPPPTIFTPATRTVGFGSVAADGDADGNMHTIWGARSPAAIFYARWDAKTQRWSDTVRLSGQIKYKAGFCNITSDRKGRIHAFWNDGENGTPQVAEVIYARSENNGLTWQQQLTISKDDGKHSAFPIVDFSGAMGDNLAVAWRDSAGRGSNGTQNWDIQISTTSDGGKIWSEPRTLISTSDYESDPNLIVGKDGRMYITFHVYPASNTYNARVMYGYSNDGGETWLPEGFKQLSETGMRSHLTKEAYDFANDRPWFFWKDERDLPQSSGGTMPSGDGRGADLMAVYVSNKGETVSKPEFMTDAGADEVGLHNFKIGDDGLPRAHYFIKQNDVTTLYYTQRKAITTGITSVRTARAEEIDFVLSPNPTSDIIRLQFTLNSTERISIGLYNTLGQPILAILENSLASGQQEILFNATNLPQGAYILRLQTPTFSHSQVVQVLR